MDKIFIEKKEVNVSTVEDKKPEFGEGRDGFEMCKVCHSIYHKKSWHHFLQSFKANETEPLIKFVICPACKMVQKGLYEGELVIKNVPEKFHTELANLIKNFTHKSFLQDPMDRLIEMKKTKNIITVKTTENQMAVRLAKKIKDAFNTVNIDIKYSNQPHDDTRVVVVFV